MACDKSAYVYIDQEAFLVANDVVYLELTNKDYSLLKVARPTIGAVMSRMDASITGVFGKGTMAMLTKSTHIGELIYHGTTRQGFSGALYVSGNDAMGMHLSGGKVNRGMAIGLIWAMVKRDLNKRKMIVHEDTAGFLDIIAGEDDPNLQFEDWGTDEVKICYKGKYHIIDRDLIRKNKKLSQRMYRDISHYEEESLDPASFLGLGDLKSSQTDTKGLDIRKLHQSIQAFSGRMKGLEKKVLQLQPGSSTEV